MQNLDPIGLCPLCGSSVVESDRTYRCSDWRAEDDFCPFIIGKTISRRRISREEAAQLLTKGHTDLLTGFSSRSGAPFRARLALHPDHVIRLEYSSR